MGGGLPLPCCPPVPSPGVGGSGGHKQGREWMERGRHLDLAGTGQWERGAEWRPGGRLPLLCGFLRFFVPAVPGEDQDTVGMGET